MDAKDAKDARDAKHAKDATDVKDVTVSSTTKAHDAAGADGLTSKPTVYYIIFFTLFYVSIQALGGSIGTLVYLPFWGMTVTELINGFSFGFIVNFCVSLYVSTIADNLDSPRGRRKPFVLYGVIIEIIACIMLISGLGKNTNFIGTWYLICYAIYNVGSGLVTFPLASWYVESSKDNEDYRYLMTVILPICGLTGALTTIGCLVAFVNTYALFVIVFLVFYLGFAPLALYFMITRVQNKANRKSAQTPPLVPSCRLAARSNEFRRLFWSQVGFTSAIGVFGNTIYFIIFLSYYNAVQKTVDISKYILIYTFVAGFLGLLGTVSLNWVLQYVDKLVCFRCTMSITCVIFLITFFTTLNPNNASWGFFLFLSIMVASLTSPLLTLLVLLAKDLVTLDTFVTGMNRENMFLTVLGLPSNILLSIICGIYISIIDASGFKQGEGSDDTDDDYLAADTSYTTASLWLMRLGVSFVPLCIMSFAVWNMRNYSLTESVAGKLNTANKLEAERQEKESSGDENNDESRESESIGDQAVTVSQVYVNSTEAEKVEGGEKADIGNKKKQKFDFLSPERALLLHLAVEELKKISITKETVTYTFYSGSLNATLMLIRRLNKVGLISAIFCCLFTLLAYIINTTFGDSGVASLLMTILTATVAYVVYEAYRYSAIYKLRAFKEETLKETAELLLDEMFDNYHVVVTNKLNEAGILLDTSENNEENEGGERKSILLDIRGTIVEPLKAANRDAKYATNNMDDQQDNLLRTTHGYKRIYMVLASIAVFALIIIITGFTAN